MSEGAEELVGGQLTEDQIEPMDSMTEAMLMLCDCPEAVTGQTCVSLDLLESGLPA
jgi:hypothetical protein